MTKKYLSFSLILLASFICINCGLVKRYTPLTTEDITIVISPNFKFNQNKKIVVLPFYGKRYDAFHTLKTVSEEQVSDIFAAHLMAAGFFVVERSQLEKIFSELQLSMSGLLSKTDLNRIGKLMDVDILVMGNLDKWGDNWPESYRTASVRFVDITTGEVMISIICPNIKGRDYIPVMVDALISRKNIKTF